MACEWWEKYLEQKLSRLVEWLKKEPSLEFSQIWEWWNATPEHKLHLYFNNKDKERIGRIKGM